MQVKLQSQTKNEITAAPSPVSVAASAPKFHPVAGAVGSENATMKNATYQKAYAAAQAGGMNNTDCHEFAQDQVEQEVNRCRAIKRKAQIEISNAQTWVGDTTSAPEARTRWNKANIRQNELLS
jgi:hypothetical protein